MILDGVSFNIPVIVLLGFRGTLTDFEAEGSCEICSKDRYVAS